MEAFGGSMALASEGALKKLDIMGGFMDDLLTNLNV